MKPKRLGGKSVALYRHLTGDHCYGGVAYVRILKTFYYNGGRFYMVQPCNSWDGSLAPESRAYPAHETLLTYHKRALRKIRQGPTYHH